MGENDKEHFIPRKNSLTPADVKLIRDAVLEALPKHYDHCRLSALTDERVAVLGDIADTAIEVREDAKRTAKKLLKWAFFILAMTALVGAVVSFFSGIYIKLKAAFPGKWF